MGIPIASVVSNLRVLGVEDLLPPELFRRFQQELEQFFHPLYVKAIVALEEPVQWWDGNFVFFLKKGSSDNCPNAH